MASAVIWTPRLHCVGRSQPPVEEVDARDFGGTEPIEGDGCALRVIAIGNEPATSDVDARGAASDCCDSSVAKTCVARFACAGEATLGSPCCCLRSSEKSSWRRKRMNESCSSKWRMAFFDASKSVELTTSVQLTSDGRDLSVGAGASPVRCMEI